MILVFVLRRIGSRGGAIRWPLTVGWVVRVQPRILVLCHRGKRRRHFAEQRRPQVRSMEEAARRFLSPGVEYRRPNYLLHVFPPREQLGTILGAFSHTVTKRFVEHKAPETHPWAHSLVLG